MIDRTKGDRLPPARDPVEVRALHAAAQAVAAVAWEIGDAVSTIADGIDAVSDAIDRVGDAALAGACRIGEHYEIARFCRRTRPEAAVYALTRARLEPRVRMR
jgi:hypothetical protein